MATVVPGSAARVRAWFFDQLVRDDGTGILSPALISKLRMLESALPFICRAVRIERMNSLADLIPQDDVEATDVLQAINRWTTEMLTDPLPVIEGHATEFAGELGPAPAPASSGTLEAGEPSPTDYDQPHAFTFTATADVCACGRPTNHPLHRLEGI